MNARGLAGDGSQYGRQLNCKFGSRVLLPSLLSIVFLGILGSGTVAAKEKKPPSRTVSGVVFDAANNTVDGATVELKDMQSGEVLDIYSQSGGQYQFTDLSFSHDYKIKAMYKGKSSEERQISSIDTRTRPVMNLTLQ